MADLTEETKTLITISRHIELVRKALFDFASQLGKRAQLHDLSKYKEDEFIGFVEINRIAREHPYDSPEYKASLKDNNAVALHYSRNSHHPEYHPGGVADMGILDLIEMICDWKAASETYGQTSFEDSIKIQVSRFNLTPEQEYVIRLVARELE